MSDYINAIRGAEPPPAGDGRLTTVDGQRLDLELYKKNSCPYCQRVFKAIARLGLAIRMRDIVDDPEARKKLVEVGGEEQVPCLFVDGKPLYESNDIIRFLEERFARPA
ncbi:MAG TPA: glutaredoxin [Planctomycetota bacterium]|nr:glutaredoxin [Planctomycetota bacterium]